LIQHLQLRQPVPRPRHQVQPVLVRVLQPRHQAQVPLAQVRVHQLLVRQVLVLVRQVRVAVHQVRHRLVPAQVARLQRCLKIYEHIR